MAEVKVIRDKARRVKRLALDRAIEVLENPSKYSKEIYDQTYLIALKNAVPRSTEITGEDGGALSLEISEVIARKNNINTDNATNPSPERDSEQSEEI